MKENYLEVPKSESSLNEIFDRIMQFEPEEQNNLIIGLCQKLHEIREKDLCHQEEQTKRCHEILQSTPKFQF